MDQINDDYKLSILIYLKPSVIKIFILCPCRTNKVIVPGIYTDLISYYSEDIYFGIFVNLLSFEKKL